ncbi:MAG TPA: hypothetical protein VG267_01560 [Terracidiphilus sp.]|jgi:hypothetical protein|nr:hypothetical protein [Terracidiphilus sp.]
MHHRRLLFSTSFMLAAALLAGLSGCASKQQKALEQAEKQAAATGQPQQVVSVDSNGNTVTTTVQPPATGQKQPTLTTTTTPPAAGAPAPKPSDPTVSAVPPPPPPPAPVNVTIPAGTSLAIRIDQRISVKTSHVGDPFTGEVVDPVAASDGSVLIPKLSPVKGVVDAAHKRGHFKGASLLELRLTSLTLNGNSYSLQTRDLAERKKGKGKRSAAMIGGGAGLGMLVGGVATGGVGLVVGGLVGGGGGAAAAGMTGNRDLDIPAETVVHFKLADDLVVQQP